jgi:hypothetical protein
METQEKGPQVEAKPKKTMVREKKDRKSVV